MKLIRFGPKGQEKPGVLIEGIRKDCSAHFQDWDRSFFQANGLEELQKLLRQAELPVVKQEVRWGAPIARPGTILCVGLNYSDHAKESGLEPPKEPVLFMKSTNTIAGPYDTVQIPRKSQKTDWEVELGIVLKRDA
ncbi:MAG: fumarylacetoacetate hydrolase family protein, partial [Bacteroidota bacterium]